MRLYTSAYTISINLLEVTTEMKYHSSKLLNKYFIYFILKKSLIN
jgi:hypothetical protein